MEALFGSKSTKSIFLKNLEKINTKSRKFIRSIPRMKNMVQLYFLGTFLCSLHNGTKATYSVEFKTILFQFRFSSSSRSVLL